MGFFKKFANFISPGGDEDRSHWVHVRCNRCGEKIRARVDLYNELSADYSGNKTFYNCRKVLMGKERCFQQIEVYLKFDQKRKLIDQEIVGGQFISEDEFFKETTAPAQLH